MGSKNYPRPGSTPSAAGNVNFTQPVPFVGSVKRFVSLRELPGTPDPLDQEFDGEEADLAALGWQVYNVTTDQLLTRAGEVDLNANMSDTSKYRSSIYGSELIFQPAGTSGVNVLYISKPITDTQCRYVMRASRGLAAAGTGSRELGLAMTTDLAPPYFGGSFLVSNIHSDGGNTGFGLQEIGNGYNNVVAFGASGSGMHAPYEFPNVYTIDRAQGSASDMVGFAYDNGGSCTFSTHTTRNPAVMHRVGLRYVWGLSVASEHERVDSVLRIDYIRRRTYLEMFTS